MGTNKALILHIGWSKSGTSSLQQYLAKHRRDLAADGICYPKTGARRGYGHHDLAEACRKVAPFSKQLRDFRRALETEMESFDKIIISSEGFQRIARTRNLRFLFRRPTPGRFDIAARLAMPFHAGGSYRVTTICYLRARFSSNRPCLGRSRSRSRPNTRDSLVLGVLLGAEYRRTPKI